jgi:hypothetical protein
MRRVWTSSLRVEGTETTSNEARLSWRLWWEKILSEKTGEKNEKGRLPSSIHSRTGTEVVREWER